MNARSRVESRQFSRREFLKSSDHALAASAAIGGLLPRLYAGQDDTIRLALVGCGGRGTGAVADAFSTTGGPGPGSVLFPTRRRYAHPPDSCGQTSRAICDPIGDSEHAGRTLPTVRPNRPGS